MIKKIATIALATMVWGAVTASAQNEKTDQSGKPSTEQCCKSKKCGDKERKSKKNEFAGITLTDAQKTKIDALKADFRKDKEKVSKDTKKAESKGEKLANDTKKEGRKDFKKMESRRNEYLAKIKEILTPDQYVTYLENIAKSPRFDKGHRHGGKHMDRGGKMKKHGDKMAKNHYGKRSSNG